MTNPSTTDSPATATKVSKSIFPGHIPALDGVRGLAIAIVLIYHFLIIMTPNGRFEEIALRIVSFGGLGVELFFVLSGFLITGILYDNKTRTGFFSNFYTRRFLRIFPLYYAVLCVIFGVLRWLPWLQGATMDGLVQGQWWAWLYGINIFSALKGGAFPLYLSHFWTLAVEEHFYMVWPFFVYFLRRQNLVRVCCSLIVVSCLLRMVLRAYGVNDTAVYVLTPCRLDGLCLGAFFALAVRSGSEPAACIKWLKSLGLSLAACGLSVIFVTQIAAASSFWGHIVFPPLRMLGASLVFGALLVFALTTPKGSLGYHFFNAPSLRWLGKYSYGIYVFHFFIASYFELNNTVAWWQQWIPSRATAYIVQGLFGTLAALAIALVSHRYFESFFLNLKDRLIASAPSSSAPT